MQYVSLHKFDEKALLEEGVWMENDMLPLHKKFENDTLSRLEMFSRDCWQLCCYYSHLKPDLVLRAKYFLLSQRAMKWYFRLATLPEGTITRVQLSNEWGFNIDSTHSKIGYTDCLTWEATLMKSIISRDNEAIDWLVEYPEELMRQAPVKGEEFQYMFTRFLKALFRKEAIAGKLLVDAYKLTALSLVDQPYIHTVLNYSTPVMDVWASLLSNDENEFNQRLEKGLLLYRDKYIGNDSKTSGSISINIDYTALAALAFDKGWEIKVHSPYIPDWMIEGII